LGPNVPGSRSLQTADDRERGHLRLGGKPALDRARWWDRAFDGMRNRFFVTPLRLAVGARGSAASVRLPSVYGKLPASGNGETTGSVRLR